MKDSLRIRDEIGIDEGVLSIPHTSARMIGEVTIEEIDPLGNVVFSSKEYNDITIGGATFVLEQMFKRVSTYTRFRLSGLNAVDKDSGWMENVTDTDISNERIFGFMIGIGGEDGIAVRSPKFITTALDSFIPFRMHPLNNNTIVESKQERYALARNIKINDDTYKGYYVKQFSDTENASSGVDTSVQIIPEYTDGSGLVTPENLGSTDSPIYTYAKAIMEIDTEDVREYFRAKDGVLNNCRINQLGLVAGKEVGKINGVAEFDDVRLVTIVNFKGRELSNDENTIRFRYKIYCM